MAKKNDIKAMFNKAKKETDNGKKKGGNRDLNPLPDGTYFLQLTNAETFTSRESQKTYLKLAWCVIRGEAFGEVTGQLRELTSEKTLGFILNELDTMGVDVESLDIEDTDDILDIYLDLIKDDTVIKAGVVNKDINGRVFNNIYVNDAVDVDADELVEPKDYKDIGSPKEDDDSADDDNSGDDSPSDDPEVGDEVTIEVDGKDIKGKIDSVDDDKKTVVVKAGRRKHKNISFDDVFYGD